MKAFPQLTLLALLFVNSGSPAPCQPDSCKDHSSCVNLNNTYFCLCLEGYYYNSSKCIKGKIFPGTLGVQVPDIFILTDKNSMAYQEFHNKIIDFACVLYEALSGSLQLKESFSELFCVSARSEMRADEKIVNAKLVTILVQDTVETEQTVSQKINKKIGNSGDIESYTMESRCDYHGCKIDSDACVNGLTCSCKDDLQRPSPQSSFCLAFSLKCPDNCNGKHRQCLVKDGKVPECVCMPGYKEDAHKMCQRCPFGYSGLDCQDQFQLILTIVGTIAGIIILSMIIALIFIARSKNKNKDIEEQNLIEEDFNNLRLQQTGFSNPGAEGSIFPKIRVAEPQNIQPQNPYLNHRGGMPRPDY
ncbi:mucin-13 [Carlito syrichta]|uniref:Mucin-13 n=1 Tax=Carlito syrichta TaxID=1868482 RepID=A0A3Q0DD76_CARSF|nr:mucin-13 [Carlito syrichta]